MAVDRPAIRDVLADRDLCGTIMVRALVEKALAQASLLSPAALAALAQDFRARHGGTEAGDRPLMEALAKHLEAMAREKR